MAEVSAEHTRRAARHEARARNFLQKAELLLDSYTAPDSASALMYEAAKQCINAVANQMGTNPATTTAKINALRAIANRQREQTNIMLNWRAANRLHVHTDRGNLTDELYAEAWIDALSFIEEMLSIYASGIVRR